MIWPNKIGILNKKWRITLPAVVISTVFPFFFFSSVASAQGSSGRIELHYIISSEIEEGFQAIIRYAIDHSKSNDEEGEIQIMPCFLSRAALVDSKGHEITSDKEFFNWVKEVKKGKFALTINPELEDKDKVKVTLKDLYKKDLLYTFYANRKEKHFGDRLDYDIGRIHSIIRGGPYKFLFSCFEYSGKERNKAKLPKDFAGRFRDRLKDELKKEDWKQYRINVDYLTLDQCKNFEKENPNKYCLEYDCIVFGTIVTEDNSVNIELSYTKKGAEKESMGDFMGKYTDDLVGTVVKRISKYLPNIMRK